MTIQKSIKYNPFTIDGEKVNSECTLTLNILEKSGNYLIHKDILRHKNSQRQATSSSKTRSEVQGGGRKPWKQKGTGRARAGSNRSPLWKGGGVIFGPKPKKKSYKLNKKERKLSLQTLLYNRKNNLLLINDLENDFDNVKTKKFTQICQNCKINLDQQVLVIVSEKTKFLKAATRNIKNVELISASQLNTSSLIKAQQVIITPSSINSIRETFCE